VIGKLDRFSRNAAFILALRDSGVRFVAVDMPEANDLTVGIMAIVAQAVRRTAMQTAVRMITTAVMLALLAGIAIKLKIFGGSP
jgi:hypothetical protein